MTRDENGLEYKINCLNSENHFCCRKSSGRKSTKYCCDYSTYLDNIMINFFAISFYFITNIIATIVLLAINVYLYLNRGRLLGLSKIDSRTKSDLEAKNLAIQKIHSNRSTLSNEIDLKSLVSKRSQIEKSISIKDKLKIAKLEPLDKKINRLKTKFETKNSNEINLRSNPSIDNFKNILTKLIDNNQKSLRKIKNDNKKAKT